VKFGLDIDCDGDEIAYQIGVLSRKGARAGHALLV
jgi:hypothetical protein